MLHHASMVLGRRVSLVGRRFRMWLKREGGAVLRGEIVGAGNEPIPVVLRKAPGP